MIRIDLTSTPSDEPRRFHLIRHEDETGVSGTGVIVEGVEFTDGTVALRWRSEHTSTAVFASIGDVRAVHGHGGKTVVDWLDNRSEESTTDGEHCCPFGDMWWALVQKMDAATSLGVRIDPGQLLDHLRKQGHFAEGRRAARRETAMPTDDRSKGTVVRLPQPTNSGPDWARLGAMDGR